MQINEQVPETTYANDNERYIVNDIVLFAHRTCGVLATLGALWPAGTTVVLMVLAWILGAYWYLLWFPAEKAPILVQEHHAKELKFSCRP